MPPRPLSRTPAPDCPSPSTARITTRSRARASSSRWTRHGATTSTGASSRPAGSSRPPRRGSASPGPAASWPGCRWTRIRPASSSAARRWDLSRSPPPASSFPAATRSRRWRTGAPAASPP
jgi:hypothetical protein